MFIKANIRRCNVTVKKYKWKYNAIQFRYKVYSMKLSGPGITLQLKLYR